MSETHNVQVAVRIRAMSSKEMSQKENSCVRTAEDGEPQIVCGTSHSFTYDYVFDGSSSQETVYDMCVRDLVDCFFSGFNATILAYGQTGSGKTYTMGSESNVLTTLEAQGIIPRVIQSVFARIDTQRDADNIRRYNVKVQFLEVYGDDILDLLHRSTDPVTIRELANGEMSLQGVSEVEVTSSAHMMRVLDDGSQYRTTAATKMNKSSSRSHAIFTVLLETTVAFGGDKGTQAVQNNDDQPSHGTNGDGGHISPSSSSSSSLLDALASATDPAQTETRKCKFHFVDLAGSERVKRTGAEGTQLREGIEINKGLLALGNVISALGDEQKRGRVHVPYRDSKLTRMLQDSLGGNSKTLVICCVSPGESNFYESLNALRYANRARNIKNRPVVNRDPTSVMIHELRNQVGLLARELLYYRQNAPSGEGLGDLQPNATPAEVLEALRTYASPLSRGGHSDASAQSNRKRDDSNRNSASGISSGVDTSLVQIKKSSDTHELAKEVRDMKKRAIEAESEVQRLSEKLKVSKQIESDLNDCIVLIQGERDFFKLKWSGANPDEVAAMAAGSKDLIAEQATMSDNVKVYLAEIAELKASLAASERRNGRLALRLGIVGDSTSYLDSGSDGAGLHSSSGPRKRDGELQHIEAELTLNISKVIAQTQEQLRQDEARLLGLNESKEGGAAERNGSTDTPDSAVEGDDMQNEKNYQLRQRRMGKEMEQLSESILMKEQLVSQLQKSQSHYDNMKDFYSQRLESLEVEMHEKEAERDRLNKELEELEDRAEMASQKQERLINLRGQLKQKGDELKALKRRQAEMKHLNEIQNGYVKQLAKLHEEIDGMKKKRVELSKMLAVEKRRHLAALNEKMREIERLKKSIRQVQAENTKLGKDNAKVVREKLALRKKFNEANVAAQANKTRQLMGRVAQTSRPVFSENDLKRKRLLDKRVAAITKKEEMVEQLRGQCAQQLRLLEAKSRLEEEKGGLRDLISSMCGDTDSDGSLKGEEERAMRDIEDRMESLEGQLVIRKERIAQMEKSLTSSPEDPHESAMKELKSMPLTHDVIRLIFDMLVSARREAKGFSDQLRGERACHLSLREELSLVKERLTDASRAVDVETTSARLLYEDKLYALYERCALLQHEKQSASDDASKSLQIMLAINKEQQESSMGVAKARLVRIRELERDMDELDASRQQLMVDLEESKSYVKFLEDERNFFREMADDLKSGLRSLDGDQGKCIIEQIVLKDRIDQSGLQGKTGLGSNSSDNVLGMDEESESVLGDFSDLAFQIEQTGHVDCTSSRMSEESRISLNQSPTTPPSTGRRGSRDQVVFDRLTNPSNFTGRAKKIFEYDIADKRKRVLKTKQNGGAGVGTTPVRDTRHSYARDKGLYLTDGDEGITPQQRGSPDIEVGGSTSASTSATVGDAGGVDGEDFFSRLHSTNIGQRRRSMSIEGERETPVKGGR